MTEMGSDTIWMAGTAVKTMYDQEMETTYYPDTGEESVTMEGDLALVSRGMNWLTGATSHQRRLTTHWHWMNLSRTPPMTQSLKGRTFPQRRVPQEGLSHPPWSNTSTIIHQRTRHQ